jgi:hypothetical protein
MGCFVEVDRKQPTPSAPTGSLTVLWTVNNRDDPRACAIYGRGAKDFELLLYQDDKQVLDRYAPCEDYKLTVDLRTGRYTGLTTLVSPDNQALTTTLPLKDITILRDAELTIDVDFPAASFL